MRMSRVGTPWSRIGGLLAMAMATAFALRARCPTQGALENRGPGTVWSLKISLSRQESMFLSLALASI